MAHAEETVRPMQRIVLMILVVALFLARPAWPQTHEMSGVQPAAAPQPRSPRMKIADLDRPSRYDNGDGAPVLFVPVQPGAYGAGAGMDNYGRPLQPRPAQ